MQLRAQASHWLLLKIMGLLRGTAKLTVDFDDICAGKHAYVERTKIRKGIGSGLQKGGELVAGISVGLCGQPQDLKRCVSQRLFHE